METTKDNEEFISFRQILLSFLLDWQLLVIGVIIGAAVGFGFHTIKQPIYESVAVYSFSIDFARTGLLTDIEEDLAMEVAGDILQSSEVMENTIKAAGELGIKINPGEEHSIFHAERRFNQWLLKVILPDAEQSAQMANLWGEAARSVLTNSEMAAMKADGLQRQILSLETCLQQSTSGLPAQPLCRASNQVELLMELENSGQEMLDWRTKSNGYFPGLNFSWSQSAQIPSTASQRSRAGLVLAGGISGLMASLIFSLMRGKYLPR